jgi:hypothetical protein
VKEAHLTPKKEFEHDVKRDVEARVVPLGDLRAQEIAGVTEALSRVRIGKDAVSRIARRLQEEQKE